MYQSLLYCLGNQGLCQQHEGPSRQAVYNRKGVAGTGVPNGARGAIGKDHAGPEQRYVTLINELVTQRCGNVERRHVA